MGVEKFVPSLESLSTLGFEERNLGCAGNFAAMSRIPDTPGTLRGHFLDTPEPGARRAAKNTPRDTAGTLRARRGRETPVAGRGVGNSSVLQ